MPRTYSSIIVSLAGVTSARRNAERKRRNSAQHGVGRSVAVGAKPAEELPQRFWQHVRRRVTRRLRSDDAVDGAKQRRTAACGCSRLKKPCGEASAEAKVSMKWAGRTRMKNMSVAAVANAFGATNVAASAPPTLWTGVDGIQRHIVNMHRATNRAHALRVVRESSVFCDITPLPARRCRH